MAISRPGVLVRGAIVAGALLLAILAVRDWSTRAASSHPLAALGRLWGGHPENLRERLMLASARAARDGAALGPDGREQIQELARSAPLSPTPFLVSGAVSQLAGDTPAAIALYRAARLRDPRDPAARILLADLELRSGAVSQGLANLVAIRRIAPRQAAPVVPALAAFARSPGAAEQIRPVLARDPQLADAVLGELAADPANAGLILSLAPAPGPGARPSWQARLVETSVGAGRVAEARRLWSRFNAVPEQPGQLIFDPVFTNAGPPPPFNWQLTSGAAGVAERRPGGGLALLHFGREPTVLARQLLQLPAGRYRLAAEFDRRPEPGRLEWRLQCVGQQAAASFPAEAGSGALTATPGCPGWWLELHALAPETEQQLEVKLRRLDLRRVG